jgi:protein MBA1
MLYTWAIYKIQETATNLAIKIASKPSIFRRALLKTNRSSDILTAKALHRTLAEALAAGDKHTIARICPRKFSAPLLTSIDARPRTRRYGWELVAYTKTAYYPTIKAQRLAPLLPTKGSPILRQVVVAISSRQRRVVYDAQGQVVPGSEKEMDVIENVAIGCIIDGHTYKQGDWRILGSVKPSTLEGHQREKRFAERSNARQQ